MNIALDTAIRQLYPQTCTIVGEQAFDSEGNEIVYDLDLVNAEVRKTDYIAKRQAEYPPFTDYLDGVVKGDQAQIQAYIDACKAVKNKYPKGA
jgi:hypothetical protein